MTTLTPHIVMGVQCSYCSRHYPAPLVHRMKSNQVICENCLDWHNHALEFLGGAPPRGCQECGETFEHLRESTVGVEVKMYVVARDGIYQVLCAKCIRDYVAKRPDLYKGTQFGHQTLKLT